MPGSFSHQYRRASQIDEDEEQDAIAALQARTRRSVLHQSSPHIVVTEEVDEDEPKTASGSISFRETVDWDAPKRQEQGGSGRESPATSVFPQNPVFNNSSTMGKSKGLSSSVVAMNDDPPRRKSILKTSDVNNDSNNGQVGSPLDARAIISRRCSDRT